MRDFRCDAETAQKAQNRIRKGLVMSKVRFLDLDVHVETTAVRDRRYSALLFLKPHFMCKATPTTFAAGFQTTELRGLPRQLSTKTFADDVKVAVDRLLIYIRVRITGFPQLQHAGLLLFLIVQPAD